MKHLQTAKGRIAAIYIGACALIFISLLLGLLLGSTHIGITDIAKAISGTDRTSPEARIFLYVRLPRTLGSLLCGAALAMSGAVTQGVLSNRLASPSVIGVNAGAGLAVTLCSAFGIIGGWRLCAFAFAGAFLAVLCVSLGAKKWGASRGTVILMGVAMNALLGALSDTVRVFVPDVSIMSNDFRIGDLSSVTYAKLIPAGILIFLAATVLLTLSNELDVLGLGDESAKGLGMNTGAVRTVLLLLAAMLAGAAVSVAGLLSFVGLIVPHAVRRLSGTSRHLMPLCLLVGGGFVSLCDTLARVLLVPYELPVGIIMAFLGAPFFLFILFKGRSER